MTFSSEIYRRLDFGINILDETDERISVQEIEVSVPTRKRRTGDDLSEVDSNSVSLVAKSAYEKKQTKVKDLTKMLKNDGACSNTFFPSGGQIILWRALRFDLTKVIFAIFLPLVPHCEVVRSILIFCGFCFWFAGLAL